MYMYNECIKCTKNDNYVKTFIKKNYVCLFNLRIM